MTSYVLVHGGSQGAWCWQRLAPLLEAAPQVEYVAALDLPGHGERAGEDPSTSSGQALDRITLDDYVQAVVEAMEGRNLRDVVLIGHSLGGVTVIAAAPKVSARLKRLVFLGGMVPDEGASAAEMLAKRWGDSSSERERIAAAGQRQVFCSDMKEADATWFLGHITPEPRKPLETPVSVAALPRAVPTTYVVLTADRSLSPKFQRRVLRNLPDPEVVTFRSGRNPMISRPRALAALLLRYA